MEKIIKKELEESSDVISKISSMCINEIRESAEVISRCLKNGGKVLLCGNGGSAADSQHIATELVIRLTSELDRRALPAIALTTNTSILTAGANDYGFEYVFSRQVEAFGKSGDVLIGISTSGNSENVVKAIIAAKKSGLFTIGLLGGNGGKLKEIVDLSIIIPSDRTTRIQEGHCVVGHILCKLIEKKLFCGV
ncbi:phosphoheptose isomerase [candidate division KSB1 bacterium]|nr:MAG: phosphoheptose isomerase [candidate division KSB1 bacterium]